MTIHVALQHQTRYRYDRRVDLGPQLIRLRPAPHCRTHVLTYSLRVGPEPHFINWQQDPFSNWQARFVFPEPTDHFDVTVDLVAELAVLNPFDFFVEDGAQSFPFAYAADLAQDLEPYLRADPQGPRFEAYLAGLDLQPAHTVDFLVALNQRLQQDITYLVRMEPGVQPPEETLARGLGSCRDSAWLLVQLLRRLNVAARFVSGYLIQLKPDQAPLEGPVGAAADFTDLHAWAEVFLPGAGWIGLDPTSGLLTGEGHLPLAATPDPYHAAPITGSVAPCEVSFDHSMNLERVFEAPRVTKPYLPAAWAAIDALGDAIDARLRLDDVGLTVGGAPTFVSVDGQEDATRGVAAGLARRLQQRFAPSGLLTDGAAGALTLHWRKDGKPLLRENHPPPADASLQTLELSIERDLVKVATHPWASWCEQTSITRALYEEARLAGLNTTRFTLDGRPAGTGGGNPVVVGGTTPADSPFLRRPDLLASCIRYWQNHPALSYLFSGHCIGPWSRAPRLDEVLQDQLYELELALAHVPNGAASGALPPGLVDRLFSDLLVDVTGNTQRTAIGIDKLHRPDTPAGRLGLVTFRAFEMPPHPEMSLVQQLLVRALVAWFWREPYTHALKRFGAALHDRFMLPAVVWADLEAVLADLSAAGLPFDAAWFRPHFEFRFPLFGEISAAGMTVELRAALEPRRALAAGDASDGTARPVDNSLERLQVKVTGPDDGRFVVACNGWRLPLHAMAPATAPATRVAGVRFRVSPPASYVHPTIGVHSPLVFDIVDTAASRAVGGCTYHVLHPDGRPYDALPVNELEAQARRHARFQRAGHTPGPIRPRALPPHAEAPWTLDLRRAPVTPATPGRTAAASLATHRTGGRS